ncbi:MFS transporter, partial [Yersinia enterocolitica]
GISYDHIGFADTYMVMGAIVLGLTVISCFMLRVEPPTDDPSLQLTTK